MLNKLLYVIDTAVATPLEIRLREFRSTNFAISREYVTITRLVNNGRS